MEPGMELARYSLFIVLLKWNIPVPNMAFVIDHFCYFDYHAQ